MGNYLFKTIRSIKLFEFGSISLAHLFPLLEAKLDSCSHIILDTTCAIPFIFSVDYQCNSSISRYKFFKQGPFCIFLETQVHRQG